MYMLAIIAIIVFLDQFIKYQIINKVMPFTNIVIIKNLFYITYLENRGIAFGLFKNRNVFFIITTSLIIIILFYFLYFLYNRSRLLAVCLALIIGGAIGNLIDRIKLGYVVDYIQFTFFPPVFNLADAAIVCGAILLSILLFFDKNLSI